MGFEPQTAGQPLVDIRKRTTKVNFAIVASVVLFLVFGICYAVWVSIQDKNGEHPAPPAASGN